MKVILLTSADHWGSAAEEIVRAAHPDVEVIKSHYREIFGVLEDCDLLLSFMSRLIVPRFYLNKHCGEAINWHPAPPDYPGIGGCSRAIYNGDKQYGVTVHRMAASVDTGSILDVVWMRIKDEDPQSLYISTRARALLSLYNYFKWSSHGFLCVADSNQWSPPAWSGKMFKDWMTLPEGSSQEEIDRMVRACRFPGKPGPFIRVGDHIADLA